MPNPIKPKFKTEWLAILSLILAAGLSFYFYKNFPAQVPIHWNINGEVDNYGSAAFSAFFLPILMLVIYLVFLILPYLDPRRERYSEFSQAYHLVKSGVIVFMFSLFILIGLAGLGYGINISFWVPVMVGVLFMGLGLVMKQVKPNWFMGIRTPWTLSSEKVWTKTHDLAAPVMSLGGILIASTGFFSSPAIKMSLFVGAIVIIAIGLPLYSYFLYRQERTGK